MSGKEDTQTQVVTKPTEGPLEKLVELGIEELKAENRRLKEQLATLEGEKKNAIESSENRRKQLEYQIAENANFKRRAEVSANIKIESSKAELFLKFVAVLDEVHGVQKNIEKLLHSEGVKEIEAIQAEFDPNWHDARLVVTREDLKENTITAVIRKGYTFKEKVLRPSLVEVSKKGSPASNHGRGVAS